MKYIGFIVILLFTLFTALRGEVNYYRLYKNDITNRRVSGDSVNKILAQAAEIHPELIYFAVKMLNGESAESYQNALYRYGKNKNSWLSDQLRILTVNGNDTVITKKAESILNKYRVAGLDRRRTVAGSQPASSDSLYYFLVKFYKNNPEMNFNRNKNYKEAAARYEAKIFGKLAALLNKKVRSKKIDYSAINFIFKYWYILDRPQFRGKYREPAEYILAVVSNGQKKEEVNWWKPRKKLTNHFTLSLGYGIFSGLSREISYTGNYMESGCSIKSSLVLSGFRAGIGFYLSFSEKQKIFNYLQTDINIFIPTATIRVDSVFNAETVTYETDRGSVTERYVLNSFDRNYDNYKGINLSFRAPLIYIIPDLALEALLSIDYSAYTDNTEYSISYYKRLQDIHPIGGGREYSPGPEEIKEFSFSPGISLNYIMKHGVFINLYYALKTWGFSLGLTL
jgi:hypothetical protein